MGKKTKNIPERLQQISSQKKKITEYVLLSDESEKVEQMLGQEINEELQEIRSSDPALIRVLEENGQSVMIQKSVNEISSNNKKDLNELVNSKKIELRQYELEQIKQFIRNKNKFKFLHVAGCSGSGKTLSVSYALENEQKKQQSLWFNGFNNSQVLISDIQKKIQFFKTTFTLLYFIIIDEFDVVEDQNIVLEFIMELNIRAILISNRVSTNLHSLYSSKTKYLFFTPYTSSNMIQIVSRKLNQDDQIIDKQAIKFIVKKISINSSDIRKVFKIIEKSYELSQKSVTLQNIQKAWRLQNRSPMYQYIKSLSPFKKNILEMIINYEKHRKKCEKNKVNKKGYIKQSDICENISIKNKQRTVESILKEFEQSGIIKVRQVTSIRTVVTQFQIKLQMRIHHLVNAFKQLNNQ